MGNTSNHYSKKQMRAHLLLLENKTLLVSVIAAIFAASFNLSGREMEILILVLQGQANKDIASQLFISENTVKFHMRNLLHKTGCSNRTELNHLFASTEGR